MRGGRSSGGHTRRRQPRWLASLLLNGLLLLAVFAPSCAPRVEPGYDERVRQAVGDRAFELVRYEITVAAKEVLGRATIRVSDAAGAESRGLVLRYLETAHLLSRTRDEAEALTAAGGSPQEVARLERRVTALRERQAAIAPTVERIIESQVAAVLADEDLGWLGTPLPPPAFDFTETPTYLVLSPRDEIRTRLGIHLQPGLSIREREELEATLEAELDNTSALVAGTGGFSTWPAMMVDTAGLEWSLSTVAHEWVHVYLALFPLGRAYLDDSNMTAINETVATLVGDEVGARALRRFYPDLVTEAAAPHSETPPDRDGQPPEFDFREEMRRTRAQVDELLAAGRVEEAEQYMEARRLIFVENGHNIRRLNQAYFAFHGSYRTGPAAPSEDPILPRLERLRAESGSLGEFVAQVRGLSRFEELLALVPEA